MTPLGTLDETIRRALINVLMNTSNYPLAAQVHILGRDNGVLLNRATEAVVAALSPRVVTREQVADLIARHVAEEFDGGLLCHACLTRWSTFGEYAEHLADAVLALLPAAAAPRVVTTAAELDALPAGAVVIDGTRWRASQKHGDGKWWRTGDVNPTLGGRTSDTLLRYGPCAVVWTPPQPDPTPTQ